LLMDILGLAMLDISGVFGRIFGEVKRLEATGDDRIPSRYVREIIVSPDEAEWISNLRHRVFSAPQTGVQVIAAGCAVQLVGTWL
jgi:hypothetical protein